MNGTQGMNGPNDLDADRRIADWLETGPTTLPDATNRAIRVAIHTAPRKRSDNAPWRYLSMPAFRIALGATVIGVILLGGSIAFRQPNLNAPGASPATCATPAAPAVIDACCPAPSPAPSPVDTSTWVRVHLDPLRLLDVPSRRLDRSVRGTDARVGEHRRLGPSIPSTDTFQTAWDNGRSRPRRSPYPRASSEADWSRVRTAPCDCSQGWPVRLLAHHRSGLGVGRHRWPARASARRIARVRLHGGDRLRRTVASIPSGGSRTQRHATTASSIECSSTRSFPPSRSTRHRPTTRRPPARRQSQLTLSLGARPFIGACPVGDLAVAERRCRGRLGGFLSGCDAVLDGCVELCVSRMSGTCFAT